MDSSLAERAAAAERDYADTAARAFAAVDTEHRAALAAYHSRPAGADTSDLDLVGVGIRHFDARAAAEHYLGAICREYVAAAARMAELEAQVGQLRELVAVTEKRVKAVRGALLWVEGEHCRTLAATAPAAGEEQPR